MILDIKIDEAQLADFTLEYQETLTSEMGGKQEPNPQTREEFARDKIKSYVHNVIESVVVNKAVETARSSKIAETKVDLASLKVEAVK